MRGYYTHGQPFFYYVYCMTFDLSTESINHENESDLKKGGNASTSSIYFTKRPCNMRD